MDANAKLGPECIQGDPYKQSQNGKVIASIIERHALCVANGITSKRKGLFTRVKDTVSGIQISVMDFVIISRDLLVHMEKIHTDDERLHVLTKNMKTKSGRVYSESDHNLIHNRFKLSWCQKQFNTIEVFKYNDKEAQETVRQVTSDTSNLSEIIDMKKPIDTVSNKFQKIQKGFIHNCFKKVKIIEKPDEMLKGL